MESFLASVVQAEALESYDPVGCTMAKQALVVQASQMKPPEINWEHIEAILARAQELHESGKMDRASWLALVHEFGAASHGSLEMPAILGRSAESEWFDALRDRSSERVA